MDLGCYFEYEPAKYLLDTLWYVPDFYVRTPNGLEFFIEIKPNHELLKTATKTQKTAIWQFCKFVSVKTPHKHCVIFMGDPEVSFEFIVCTNNSTSLGRRLTLLGPQARVKAGNFWQFLI